MVTLIKDPFIPADENCGEGCSCDDQSTSNPVNGYNGYVEPDADIPPKPNSILDEISVNGVSIDEADIMAEAQQHPASSPGKALLAAARALIVRELLLQEAKALNIQVEPQQSADGSVEASDDALIRQLMDQEIDTPQSDETVRRRYYELHKHRFTSETIYEARHILLVCQSEDRVDAQRELAQSLIDNLVKQPSAFGQLAKDYSDCPSKNEGGNLGQLTTGSTVPEFESVLTKMRADQIWPEPVQSRFGFHIIYLVNKIPGEVLPFVYVQDRIGAWLEASSWSKAVAQYISILAGRAKITGIDLDAASSPLVQ